MLAKSHTIDFETNMVVELHLELNELSRNWSIWTSQKDTHTRWSHRILRRRMRQIDKCET
jgi:hypothetical protein